MPKKLSKQQAAAKKYWADVKAGKRKRGKQTPLITSNEWKELDKAANKLLANQIQHGGTHYKTEPGFEEHWDRIWRTRGVEGGRGYFIGCITKYVERFDKKNGIEDLKKAQHYIQKLIELEEKENARLSKAGIKNDG